VQAHATSQPGLDLAATAKSPALTMRGDCQSCSVRCFRTFRSSSAHLPLRRMMGAKPAARRLDGYPTVLPPEPHSCRHHRSPVSNRRSRPDRLLIDSPVFTASRLPGYFFARHCLTRGEENNPISLAGNIKKHTKNKQKFQPGAFARPRSSRRVYELIPIRGVVHVF
jgi:hypothetical protein